MSHWLYKNEIVDESPEGAEGFVYRVTNTITGRMYIGRKYFTRTKRKKVKNMVRRRVVKKGSGWQSYTGSNKSLNEDIKNDGIEHFKFEILAFGYTKGQVNFLEEHVQHRLNVLVDERYYNDSIGSRKYIGVRIDDNFKQMIRDMVL